MHMGNYMIAVANYVTATPSSLGNSVMVQSLPRRQYHVYYSA
jgi:hypothetical protein